MADTSNLSQFLTDVADAIRTKKETTEPIAAEQFDQEILSIETGSGDIPVKLFETIDEMQADPDANEGDLALVYRNESLPMTSSSVFTTVIFPDTVVFDTAITSSGSGYLYDENQNYETQCQLRYSSTYFYIRDYYTYKYIVRYTSTDGITYTLDSGYETSYTFEQSMHFEGTWNKAYGQFIYCGGQYFEGLFEYKNVVSNHIVEFYKGLNIIKPDGTTGVNWTDQKNIDVKNLMTVLDKIIADLNYTYVRANVEYVSDGEFVLYVCNDESNTFLHNSYLGRATGLYLMTGNQKSATQFKKIVVNTIDLTYNISTLSVSGTVLNGLDYLVELNDDHYYTIIDYRDYAISLSNTPEVNIQQLKDGSVISQQKLTVMGYEDTYVIAQTQLTINNKNQLLPGVVAYGNKGIIEGDGSISNHIPSMIKDLFGNNETLNIKYLTVDPYSNETKKYTLCERDEANVALVLTQPGEFSSSPAIFYQNGTNKNYYVDGEYYYIAKQGTTDVLTLYQLDKQFHLIHTYTINIPNVPTGTTRKGTAITKYNDTWHLLFVNGGSTTSFSYGYGTFDLETSSYTSILSGTKDMQSTSYTSLITPWLTAYGNKIGFGVVQVYKTSSSGKYNYKGYVAFVDLDSGEMTTILDVTTLASNQSTSYTEHIVTAMNDKYLAFHITYFNADSVNAAYNLSYNFDTLQSTKSTTVSGNDDLIRSHLKWIEYLGEEYAWAFNSTYAARLQLSTGKADILTLDKNPVYMDETSSYGIAPGVIYNFEGDQYTIEENPLVENISSGFFTKLLRTDNYIANLGIKTSKIYWYAKIEETDSYDIIATNSTTTTCIPMVPYFTAPAHKFKLDEIYFGKVYEDTISPVEYDTALETAQDILGKEVTE